MFFVKIHNFKDLIWHEFRLEINCKKLQKFLKFRTIFILVFVTTLTILDFCIDMILTDFGLYFKYFLILIENLQKFFLFYKFCFYLDLICICLKNFLDIFNQITFYKHNKLLLLHKIYQIRRCYIFIIDMSEELNDFLFCSIRISQMSEILWILSIIYYILFFMAYNFVDFDAVDQIDVFGMLICCATV